MRPCTRFWRSSGFTAADTPRRWPIVLLVVLGVVAGTAAGVSESPPALEVAAGFGGFYQVGSWLPVRVTVENRGADWRGELRVALGPAPLVMPLTLPAPSRKSFSFGLPAPPAGAELEVRLVAGGSVAAAAGARLQPLSAKTPLYVVVSERLPATRPRPRPGGRLAFVRAPELPERWNAYRGVEAVAVDAASAGELRPAQRQALSDWLLTGGRLVLSAAQPARLRPVLESWSLTPAESRGELPGEFRWGRGVVRLVRAPVEPLTAGEIRSHLSGRPPVPVEPAGRRLLLRSPPPAEIGPRPGGPLIVHWLVYLVAVVAAATFLARPPHHPRWSFAALAGLALVQILSLGILGRSVGGGRVLVSTGILAHVLPGVEESFVAVRGDFLSPVKGEIRFEARLRDAAIEAEGVEEVVYRLSELDRPSVGLPVALWSRGRIYAAGFAATGLRLEAAAGGPARIVNRSQLGLTRCHHLGPDLVRPLPDLPPGQSLALPAGAASRPAAGSRPPGDDLLGRILSVYRLAGLPERAGETVVCSASGALPGLASDRPWKQVGGAAVVIFHLPHRT